MREVLYRAKRKDNGEWIKGYYVRLRRRYNPCDSKIVHYIISRDAEVNWYNSFHAYYEIIPETLGRMLEDPCWNSDCDGREFFQDDIVAVWGSKCVDIENTKPNTIALVIDEHSISHKGGGRWFPQDTTRVKIIGNAHDHPELLDGHDVRQFISEIGGRPDDPDEYIEQHHYLTDKYSIHGAHAGCYICNFENDYICHQYNGGCDRIDTCRRIREEENETK